MNHIVITSVDLILAVQPDLLQFGVVIGFEIGYVLARTCCLLSAGMAIAVSEDGAGAVVTGEALSAPQHAHIADSIRGPSLAATKGGALAKGDEDELG